MLRGNRANPGRPTRCSARRFGARFESFARIASIASIAVLFAGVAIPAFAGDDDGKATAPSSRSGPITEDPGDIVVGDAENEALGDPNDFNFPDAFDLRFVFPEDDLEPLSYQFSYYVSDTYTINGAAPLAGPDLLGLSVSPAPAERIDQVDLDTGNPGQDATAYTLTFRNVALSPPGGPNVDPGGGSPIAGQTRVMTIFASDGTTVTFESLVVYTSDDTSDSLSVGENLLLRDDAFPAALEGWFGATQSGAASVATSLSGLEGMCLGTGLEGANAAAWGFFGGAYGGYVELVSGAVWRIRTHVTSDRTDGSNNQPFFDLILDNTTQFYDGISYQFVSGMTYAGEYPTLDHEGGANSIGKPQGRDFLDHFFAPPGVSLPQWNGAVDQGNSAFATSVDDSNDFCPTYWIFDTDPALHSELRDGVLCVGRVQVFSNSLSALEDGKVLEYAAPIASTTHFAINLGGAGGEHRIDDVGGFLDMQLTNNTSPGARGSAMRVGPYDQALAAAGTEAGFNAALYPVRYTADTLYMIASRMESRVEAGMDALPGMPVDIVNLVAFQPSLECLGSGVALGGSVGNMSNASSPRNPASVGGAPQDYLLFFYTNNRSLTGMYNGVAFGPQLQFFNNNPAFPGPGTDPFRIRSLEVYNLGTTSP